MLEDRATRHRLFKWLAAFVCIGALVAAWRFTPLAHFASAQNVVNWAQEQGAYPLTPVLVIAAYTPASVIMFPRPLITLFAFVAFGVWFGLAIALAGILLAAWFAYLAGRHLSRERVAHIAGDRLLRIGDALAAKGWPAMTAIRLVPIAPFAVESVFAGAIRIRAWHFLLGTALGLLPGMITTAVVGSQLEAAADAHGSVNYSLIAGAVAGLALASWWVRRWVVDLEKQAARRNR